MGQALRIIDGGQRPPLALELPDETTFDEWVSIGRRLCLGSQALNWHIGDWWAFGDHRYGERAKAAAEGIFGREFGSLMNLATVARAYEPSRRHEVLSFTHHAEVVALPEDKRSALLEKAEREHLSTRDLRREVQAIKAANDPAPAVEQTPPTAEPKPAPHALQAEIRKAYEVAVELGEALQQTRPLNRRERYLLDMAYEQVRGVSADLRKAPDDFEVIFVEKGRLACEDWYRASRLTVNRWLVEKGKSRLVQARADYVKHGRMMLHPMQPQREAGEFDTNDPLYRLATEAAHFLRISRYGGWRISPTGDGSWHVGTVRKTSDELIAMAERQGFDSLAHRAALQPDAAAKVE